MNTLPLTAVKEVSIGPVTIGGKKPFILIAGPCVIESEALCRKTAEALTDLTRALKIPFIFKSSYDKANRSSLKSFRGPGLKRGLEILQRLKHDLGIPVLSDVHRFEEVEPASQVLDALKIPPYKSRKTDFFMDVAGRGKPVNCKKEQF